MLHDLLIAIPLLCIIFTIAFTTTTIIINKSREMQAYKKQCERYEITLLNAMDKMEDLSNKLEKRL